MTRKKLTGTGVALITPFRKDGSVDFLSLEKLINYVIEGGVNYLVMIGTTSESPVLTLDERAAIISYAKEVNNKRVPMVVGAGCNNTQEALNLIDDCDFSDVDAILSVTPYYNKPSQRGLFLHYKEIAAASPVPVILYNVPGRTSCNMTAETTLKLAHEVPNIHAIKEASGDMGQIMKIIKDKPDDFIVLSGDDAITLPLISIGVEGVISVAGQAFPNMFSEMVRLALKGKYSEAKLLHYQLIDAINALFVEGNPAGVKAALSIMGIIENQVRLPLSTVSRSTFNQLTKLIEELQLQAV